MKISLNKGAGPQKASTQIKGNRSTTTSIGCVEVSTPMTQDLKNTLSSEDMKYIKNILAEGIARALVAKVAKSSDLAVDGLEPERYNPSTKEGGTSQ